MTTMTIASGVKSHFRFGLLMLCLPVLVPASPACGDEPIKESAFGKSLVPGKSILPAKDGWWNWWMAPIYDEQGRLHIFNSSIPFKGEKGMRYWQSKSIINHYVADFHSVLGTVEINSPGAHTLTLEIASDFTATKPKFRAVMLTPASHTR
jgi:hypothetical protein